MASLPPPDPSAPVAATTTTTTVTTTTTTTATRRKSDDSLTPNRKHRKLLKDGSGGEVSETTGSRPGLPTLAVEVAGGISFSSSICTRQELKGDPFRSKKQVASHIQVLRNMWKGEKEYQLVAAGDELFPDGHPTMSGGVKLEEHDSPLSNAPLVTGSPDTDMSHLFQLDSYHDDSSDTQSQSPSPHFMVTDIGLHSPSSTNSSPMSTLSTLSPITTLSSLSQDGVSTFTPSPLRPRACTAPSQHSPLRNTFTLDGHLPDSPMSPYATASEAGSTSSYLPQHHHSLSTGAESSLHAGPGTQLNQVTAVCLTADGMTPFTVNTKALDAVPPLAPYSVSLKIKLNMPIVGDARTPVTLQGFHGTLNVAHIWSSSAKCITKVYLGPTCISEESAELDVCSIEQGTVICRLPESHLTRCRWLDASSRTIITQQIVVDHYAFATVEYHLERTSYTGMPSAALEGWRKRPLLSTAPGHVPHHHWRHSSPAASPISHSLSPPVSYAPYSSATGDGGFPSAAITTSLSSSSDAPSFSPYGTVAVGAHASSGAAAQLHPRSQQMCSSMSY
ncbi:hypothetical protein FISHEDRAFT_71203 [Fistulina hepatica ATCC 64428]|nr:hypothetical protein FISHEDRAFT_71203 [Fistulina hepatica ATCC 64428]